MATRRDNRSPAAREAESPERELRLGEQRHLSQLNMQFENYVMNIRRREAELMERLTDGQVLSISQHQDQVSSVRQEYEGKLARLLEEHNRSLVEVEELTRRLQREAKKNEDLQKTIRQLEQVRDDLQQRIGKLSHDLDVEQAKYNKDKGTLDAMRSELDAYKKNEATIMAELDSLREENRELDSKVLQERDLRHAAQEDLKISKQNFERERKALLKKLEDLAGNADDIEREIREKLQAEMRNKLAEIREEMQSAHDEIIRKQLEDFNRQLQELRERESSLLIERDELRAKLDKTVSASFTNSKEKKDLERRIAELDKRVGELMDELNAMNIQHNKVVNSKDAEISRLLAKLKQVQDERNILFTLGVGLKKAVETYEEIVNGAEERSSKRQRVSKSPVPVSSSPAKPMTRAAKELASTPTKNAPMSASKVPLSGKRKAHAL